jgi:creatinine amidohydrolase
MLVSNGCSRSNDIKEGMMPGMRYQELLPHELEAILRDCPVAYWPLGTLEYHGPHLAIGNDALKAEGICERACACSGGVLVPALYWGIGGGHKEYPASILMSDHVLPPLLDEALEGLYRVGFRVVVMLTGHYPSEQVQAVKSAAERAVSAMPICASGRCPSTRPTPTSTAATTR